VFLQGTERRSTGGKGQQITGESKPHASGLKLIQLPGIRRKFMGEGGSYPTSACRSLAARGAASLPPSRTGDSSIRGPALLLGKPRCALCCQDAATRGTNPGAGIKPRPLRALPAFNNLLGHSPDTAGSQAPTPVPDISKVWKAPASLVKWGKGVAEAGRTSLGQRLRPGRALLPGP